MRRRCSTCTLTKIGISGPSSESATSWESRGVLPAAGVLPVWAAAGVFAVKGFAGVFAGFAGAAAEAGCSSFRCDLFLSRWLL